MKSPSGFYVWLTNQTNRNDAVGTFAKQADRDITFPKNTSHLWVFLHYYDDNLDMRETVKTAHAEFRLMCRNVKRMKEE